MSPHTRFMHHLLSGIMLLTVAATAHAQTSQQTLEGFKQSAAGTSGFQGFSATRGEQFFNSTHGNDWSCATCHTKNPAAQGKHTKTGKLIKPLAPAANAERFTDQAKIDKWFKRNCNDVLNRACTPLEKGDVLTYLMSLK
jgi:Domain of unknown function (DUF1924)